MRDTKFDCYFVGNVHVLLHTNFHCSPSLLAAQKLRISAFRRTLRVCNYACCAIPDLIMSSCQQCPCPPSYRFSLQSFTSSHHKLQISAFWRASRANMPAARTRSLNQLRNFVGNAHDLLHANFHCNPSLLATKNCK